MHLVCIDVIKGCYDLSFLSMSVMVSQKNWLMGRVSSIQLYLDFLKFFNCKAPSSMFYNHNDSNSIGKLIV